MGMRERDRRVQRMRDEIIDAAEKLFYEHGVRGTTMEMVAKEASVARVTIYNHFSCKENVLYEAFRRLIETFTKNFEAIVYDSGLEYRQKVDQLISFETEVLDRLPSDLIGALYDPKNKKTAELVRWYSDNRINIGMQHLIREGKLSGDISKSLSDASIMRFFGLFKQILGTSVLNDKKTLKDLVHMFFYGIGGKT